MIYILDGSSIIGVRSIHPKKDEKALADSSENMVHLDVPLTQPLECYQFKDGKIILKDNWDTIKAAIENELSIETPPLDVAKTSKLRRINTAYEAQLNAILKDYPEVETKTWDKQESEARAWIADNTAATPLLSEIANARGMTLDDLVPRVIAKADAWIQLSGSATGKRQALEEQIEAATTVEEVEAIQW